MAAFFLSITPALAQDNATAYEALRVVGTELGEGALSHVVSVAGVKAIHNRRSGKLFWRIPGARGGARELEVANDRITSDRPPGRGVRRFH